MSICNTLNKQTDYDLAAGFLDDLERIVGTAFALAQETGLNRELHIQEKLGEIIVQLETVKALIQAADLEGIIQASESISLQTIKANAFAYLNKSLSVLKLSGGEALRQYVWKPETAGESSYKHKLYVQSIRLISAGHDEYKAWFAQYETADETLALSQYFTGINIEKLNQRMNQFWVKTQ